MDEIKEIPGIRFSNNSSSIKLTKPVLKGDDGGFYTPSVDEEGNLNWQPSEEYMPALPSANIKGASGRDGKTPIKGVDYFDGKPGKDGSNGLPGRDGKPGANGKTPKKGVDYFTEAEVKEVEEFIKKDLQIPEENGYKEIQSYISNEKTEYKIVGYDANTGIIEVEDTTGLPDDYPSLWGGMAQVNCINEQNISMKQEYLLFPQVGLLTCKKLDDTHVMLKGQSGEYTT